MFLPITPPHFFCITQQIQISFQGDAQHSGRPTLHNELFYKENRSTHPVGTGGELFPLPHSKKIEVS